MFYAFKKVCYNGYASFSNKYNIDFKSERIRLAKEIGT